MKRYIREWVTASITAPLTLKHPFQKSAYTPSIKPAMRVLIAAIALLSIFSDPTSAHPSLFDPRAQTKNIRVPINQLLQNSKVEKSGKGTQGPLKFTGTLSPKLKALYKNIAPKPDPLKESDGRIYCCLLRWRQVSLLLRVHSTHRCD